MGIKSYPGGVIRSTPVTPAGPYQDGAASGVWTLELAAYWNKQGLWPTAGNLAPIGLFAGGNASGGINNIDRIVITTTGNATDFGDMISGLYGFCGFSSSTRGVWSGGQATGFAASYVNVIQYSTFATAGNATDFGDLSTTRSEVVGASNSTRGLTIVGHNGNGTYSNVIEYVTIASTGNATDFGDALNTLRRTNVGGLASPTRAVYAGGFDPGGEINVIGYVTIATTGNATDFGDLLALTKQPAGASSSTRGLFAGGFAPSLNTNVIQYITIATTGNAIDFGDLTLAGQVSGTSSEVRAVFGGYGNTISYVTIATTGNAIDFGDLLVLVVDNAACSSGHGGL